MTNMTRNWRDIEKFLIFCGLLIVLAVMVISFFTTPTAPIPEPPAMEWRVTDTSGETHTYPESAGWWCIGGGLNNAAIRAECWRRDAAGREAERVLLVAVRLEHVAAGDGAE